MFRVGGQRVPSQTIILLVTDAILIVAGLVIASAIRFHDLKTFTRFTEAPNALGRFGIVVLICELSLYYYDTYDPRVLRNHFELFVGLLQALGTATIGLALIYYLAPNVGLGRGIAILASPTILMLTLGSRLVLENSRFLSGAPEKLLVLGTGPAGISLVRDIIGRPDLKMKVVGFLDEKGENIGKSLVNPGIIGGCNEVESLVAHHKVDRVVISLLERRGRMPVHQLLDLKFAGIRVEDAHSVHERISGRIFLEHLSPSWLILSDGFRKSWALLLLKRSIDLLVAVIALIIALPIMLAVAAAIWLESGTPILFRQERVGLRGRHFNILKFRSMRHNAEANGPVWASADDQRVTKVGRIIRKLRLDELPQLVNVLRGEMSLVGPRPERPVFCKMIEDKVPFFAQRQSVRPGVTGWAQIKYHYGGTIEEAKTKLEYDLFYIKHLSLVLDLLILFETAKVMLSGRGAQ
ncbi:MAG TPA: TIGR03013 family XrtA/PEP-CTERM system glycosyltransferase [Terriglobales bacterium]|jgi:sugar transferase (PEP-CTERM system associated)|nr:TIGR03013 family XrtA/PEP-CTERM system glycosyltransferase [Terriglobales bacterium]